MKYVKIGVLLLVLFLMIGAVSAADEISNSTIKDVPDDSEITYTFTNLTNDLASSHESFDMEHDCRFNNETDSGAISINKSDFVLNGNNHIIDADNRSMIFNITSDNITINNLVLINANATGGAAISSKGHLTLNNVTFINSHSARSGGAILNNGGYLSLNDTRFINSHAARFGGAILNNGGYLSLNDTRFINSYALTGSAITSIGGIVNIANSLFISNMTNMRGQLYLADTVSTIENSDFINLTSTYAPAIYLESFRNFTLINSRFINLTAEISAGAIEVKSAGNITIIGCTFKNTRSSRNAGAVNVDYTNNEFLATIKNTTFENSSSLIGGAYVQLGGNMHMDNTTFTNCSATHYGGAAYLSFTISEISNCTFESNSVEVLEDYPGEGGALYSDMNELHISDSIFSDNSAAWANAIYACDTHYVLRNVTFQNNGNAIYTLFDSGDCLLVNNTYNNDSVITNDSFYYWPYVNSPALQYEPANNSMDVSQLPSRFDLRDWGWLTPVRDQGRSGACWTFGIIGALESAMLRTYGVELDLSEGNLQHNMLRYFEYGATGTVEGGYSTLATSYLVSWFGPCLEETEIYDEVGKLSPFITSGHDVIHIQDAVFIRYDDFPNGTSLKSALLKYGALGVTYHAADDDSIYMNMTASAQYVNESEYLNHVVTLVGWDDSYPKENFAITPPGDGAWIIKNSWGEISGDDGYYYISYYDRTFSTGTRFYDYAVAMLLDNRIAYNKNYEHDFTWIGNFRFFTDGNMTFTNYYEAASDDLIAAVGTYFFKEGEQYSVDIYVNGELKLNQNGTSPFTGFHTIKLNEYIPIYQGDIFNAVITTKYMPVISIADSRVHYTQNVSFFLVDGNWTDLYSKGRVACLKVFTVADDSEVIGNHDIEVSYPGNCSFDVCVVTSDGHWVVGAWVNFTVDGKNFSVLSDASGVAGLEIGLEPGTHEIETSYNNRTYKNNITVRLDVQTCRLISKDIAVDYDGGSYFSVKVVSDDGKIAVSGESVIFILNGNVITVKSDADGIAKIRISEIPKKYTIKTVYNAKTYTNSITVNHVLKTKKTVTVKKSSRKFYLKATLKINGKLMKGKKITFRLNKKTYTGKTNKKGVAKVTVKRNAIKKLKKGKKYTVKVSYLKDTIKSAVKVR